MVANRNAGNSTDHKKKHFYHESGHTQVTQRDCRVFIQEDIQNPAGCGLKQHTLADPIRDQGLGT